ncbi:MAG: hypothetical protein ABIT68_03880 [Sphingomicrobium sp.]
MGVWGKMLVAAAALSLTGCLWTPGKFTSELALHKGGAFVLDYRGEIVLQIPDDKDQPSLPWSSALARCYKDGRIRTTIDEVPASSGPGPVTSPGQDVRPCAPAELATLKTSYDKQIAEQAGKRGEKAEQMAKIFGLPGADDASNRRFAANLLKYKGWKSATYRGKGVFDVVYHFEGRADQDFAFPMIPDSDLLVPFIAIRRRNDGAVLVTAPALTGGSGPFGARALAAGLPDSSGEGPKSRAEGRFTVTTDAEILTNNSEDGPIASPLGKQLHWDVGSGSKKIPETLVRL